MPNEKFPIKETNIIIEKSFAYKNLKLFLHNCYSVAVSGGRPEFHILVF